MRFFILFCAYKGFRHSPVWHAFPLKPLADRAAIFLEFSHPALRSAQRIIRYRNQPETPV
jgi:hypothetical protein